ncbi:2311_t:CDS:2, partial [Gigaspora margarita]
MDEIVLTNLLERNIHGIAQDSLCFNNSSGGYRDLNDIVVATLNYILDLNSTAPTDISCTD